MQDFIKGIQQYQDQVFARRRTLFESIANQQRPMALVVTCSDSRIDPELLLGAQPGDLFVLRNAGNIVPHCDACAGGESATIELAVEALQVGHIVICGHTRCAAVAGLLDPRRVEAMPAVARWLEKARTPAYSRFMPLRDPRGIAPLAAVEQHVLMQLDNLQTHPSVRRGLERGTLELHGWVYHLEDGSVTAYDGVSNTFKQIAEHYGNSVCELCR